MNCFTTALSIRNRVRILTFGLIAAFIAQLLPPSQPTAVPPLALVSHSVAH